MSKKQVFLKVEPWLILVLLAILIGLALFFFGSDNKEALYKPFFPKIGEPLQIPKSPVPTSFPTPKISPTSTPTPQPRSEPGPGSKYNIECPPGTVALYEGGEFGGCETPGAGEAGQ